MIVKAAQDALDGLYAELTRLNDILSESEQDGRRGERVGEIQNTGYAMLESDDTQTANAWLRRHFRVIATSRKVVRIEVI